MKIALEHWIRERLDNCHIIAAKKTGRDRDGWLEDAEYFTAVLEALSRESETTALLSRAASKFAAVSTLADTFDGRGDMYGAKAAKIGRHQVELSTEVRELLASATTFQECAGLVREALK